MPRFGLFLVMGLGMYTHHLYYNVILVNIYLNINKFLPFSLKKNDITTLNNPIVIVAYPYYFSNQM